MTGMVTTIEVRRFWPDRVVELAVDVHNGACLLGMPFDVGCAGHVRYFEITREEFALGLVDEAALESKALDTEIRRRLSGIDAGRVQPVDVHDVSPKARRLAG